jgi:hypothetical protein
MTKIMPWVTGTACALYIYGWYLGTTFPAWVPLIWCAGCFANDLHNYLQSRHEH